jgi:hypothetical protein
MGVAVSVTSKRRVPSEKRSITDVTFDNSYQAEGEPLTAAQLGLKKVRSAICQVIHGSEAEGSPTAWYDVANSKIRLINSKTGKEVVGAVDCSKVVVRVTALGY